jgi:hypothetical protein
MTAYQGARRAALPLPSRRLRRAADVPASRGADRVVLALAAILLAFLLGLFYLTQTLRVATTDYEIDTLLSQRTDLGRQIRSAEGDIARWGAEPAVVAGAQAIGFDRLGNAGSLPAR